MTGRGNVWGIVLKAPLLKRAFNELTKDFENNLNRLGFTIVREAKKKAPVYRGMLRNRIIHEVKKGKQPFDVQLRVMVPVKSEGGFYYAKAVEFGTRPHRPPIAPIKRWVWLKRRGLGVTEKEVNSVAWAIVEKIARVGTRKHPFLRPAAEQALKTWRWW